MTKRPHIDYQQMANDDVSAGASHRNVHDNLKHLSVPELRALCDADRLPFAVCILNVTGELNTGSIVRSALLTGAERCFVFGRRRIDKRGCVGSENYVQVDRIDGLLDDGLTIDDVKFWDLMVGHNYFPVCCEQGGTPLSQMLWANTNASKEPLKPCLVFGNENRGVPDSILNDSRAVTVSIEQRGVIRSYNVSNAAAIIMHHMVSNMGWW